MKNTRTVFRVLVTIMGIAAAAITVFFGVMYYLWYTPSYDKPIKIEAPDGSYTIVVKEWEGFMIGGAEVYQQKFIFRTKIGEFGYDDNNIRAFKNGDYTVEWSQDRVTLSCRGALDEGEDEDGLNDGWTTKTFELS